jgi:N-acetylmuramoyl-L-alanine amidase
VETAGAENRVIRSYSVEHGDTLSVIASRFGVTTNTIKWANGLSDADDLSPGKEITILPVSGLLHRVAKGDTASSLARKYKSNSAQIISFNNAEVTGLKVGQRIIIPDGVKTEAPRPVQPAYAAVASLGTPSLTQFSGGANGYTYGYCTWYVANRRNIPGNWGNANAWYYNAQLSGFKVGSAPVAGAIAWTGAGYAGHVGIVESVRGNQIVISDMNYAGGWNVATTRVDSAYNYKYIY